MVISDSDAMVHVVEDFASFYRRERPGLVALALVLSGSRLGAEDLAQEALIAAYRRWETVGSLDQPVAWVRKVVANNSWSYLRRKKAEARALSRSVPSVEQIRVDELPADSAELWAEVRKLPSRQAQAVALYYVGGLTMVEVGETLGCSKETVNTHLRRARSTLARRLGVEETEL